MVRRVFAVVSLVIAGIACASPTLPLPPPEVPTIGGPTAMAGQVHLSSPCGGAEPAAEVLVVNDNQAYKTRAAVTVADGCGAWSLDVFASTHDLLEVQQIVGNEISSTLTVEVP